VPLLAVTGMTYHDLIGTHSLQDYDTDHLYSNLAVYNQRIMSPEHIHTGRSAASSVSRPPPARGTRRSRRPPTTRPAPMAAGRRDALAAAGHGGVISRRRAAVVSRLIPSRSWR
jgi:pyruvate dehydrogenase (quinone)/pyruvate oxidase